MPRTENLLGAVAGLVAALVLGVSVLVFDVPVSDSPLVTAGWWTAYSLYVVAFALDDDLLPVRVPWPPAVSLAVMVVSGMAVWLLAPHIGWSALLFVITTAAGAFILGPAALGGLVVVNSLAIATGAALAGWETQDVAFTTFAYLAFQGFAALVVTGTRREAAARAALAAAHAELRATSALLEDSSRTAERLRIARELHDVVGHQLTALTLELEVASHRCDGAGAEHVGRARAIAKDLLGDVRAAVGRLRETPTDLVATLRGIVTGLPGLAVDLDVREEVPLDEERRLVVVRWVQEVVTNALRHAHASRLTLTVVSDAAGLRMEAHDDGRGTEAVELGNGLSGMAERAAALGGTVEVESARGAGFTVRARVPSP